MFKDIIVKLISILILHFSFSVNVIANTSFHLCFSHGGVSVYSTETCAHDPITHKNPTSAEFLKHIRETTIQDYGIHRLCANQYPDEGYVQNSCIDTQGHALFIVIKMNKVYKDTPDMHKALGECVTSSTNENSLTDYSKVLHCSRNIN